MLVVCDNSDEAAGGPVEVVRLSGCSFGSIGSEQSEASLTCMAGSAAGTGRGGLDAEGFYVG